MYLTVAFVIFDQAMTENSGRERDDRSKKGTRAKQSKEKGFRLSSKPTESEDTQREKEHKDVRVKNVFGFVEYVLNDGF